MSFVSQFPELASITPENLPGALELMSRQDPQKFARVQAVVATTEQLFAQQQQESRRQAELGQQEFSALRQLGGCARLETMLKEESKNDPTCGDSGPRSSPLLSASGVAERPSN